MEELKQIRKALEVSRRCYQKEMAEAERGVGQIERGERRVERGDGRVYVHHRSAAHPRSPRQRMERDFDIRKQDITRHDYHIRPQEQSLEPPEDDESDEHITRMDEEIAREEEGEPPDFGDFIPDIGLEHLVW